MPDEAPHTPAPEATPAAPAAAPAEAAHVATPESDPTPAQVESQSVVGKLSDEIDALWKQDEARRRQPEPAAEPRNETPAPEPEPKADAPKADAPKAEPETPAPTQADLDRQAYERVKAEFEAKQEADRKAQERVAAEQRFQELSAAYIGAQPDYEAVNTALRRAVADGDFSLLDGLDVMLPNGKRISELKGGQKGLTQEEAAGLLNTWDQARAFENVMGDRKVQRILEFWDSEVVQELADPDVDGDAVRKHNTPGQQMATLRDSVRDRVTKRLTEAHTAELKAKDAEISKLTEQVASLRNERGNLTIQQRAAQTAAPDRPGQPGGTLRDLPRTAEEIRGMSADDFFKSGTADRLLQMIPGDRSRRRVG